MIYVADTHAIVWFIDKDSRLTSAAHAALSDPSAQVIVPTIALAEVAFLFSKGRTSVDVPRVLQHLQGVKRRRTYPLNDAVVRYLLPQFEIHDAIIVATAIVYRDVLGEQVKIITADREITASGVVDVVW